MSGESGIGFARPKSSSPDRHSPDFGGGLELVVDGRAIRLILKFFDGKPTPPECGEFSGAYHAVLYSGSSSSF